MTEQGIIDSGAVLFQGDSILSVFANDTLASLDSLVRSDSILVKNLDGASVIPGLIDMHSELGVEYPADKHYPDQSVLRYFLPEDAEIRTMLQGGVTTIALRPPADSLFSGYSALVKLLPDSLGGTIIVEDTLDFQISLTGPAIESQEDANSDSPVNGLSRMYRFRNFLFQTFHTTTNSADYSTLLSEHHSWPPVFSHKLSLYILTDRAAQILETHTMLSDVNANFYFGGVSQLVAVYKKWMNNSLSDEDYINGVVLGPAFFQLDPDYNRYRSLSDQLSDLGIFFAVGTHYPKVRSLSLLDRMRDFIRYGMSEQQAMESVTTVPAKLLNKSGRLGVITGGAASDFVILNGSPFDVNSRVNKVYVNGIAIWLD